MTPPGRSSERTWCLDGLGGRAVVAYVNVDHSYDDVGNRLTSLDRRIKADGQSRDVQYVYDDLHRLVEAKRGSWTGSTVPASLGSQKWTLDALGNQLTVQRELDDIDPSTPYDDDGETTDITDGPNYVNEIAELTIDETTPVELPFAYDDAGNMTERGISGSSSYVLVHDAWNRLVRVDLDDGTTVHDRAEYEYNGLHHRIVKRADTDYDGDLDQQREMYYAPSWQLLYERIGSSLLRKSGAFGIERGFVLVAPAIRRHIRCDTSRIDGATRAEARRFRTVGVPQQAAGTTSAAPATTGTSATSGARATSTTS